MGLNKSYSFIPKHLIALSILLIIYSCSTRKTFIPKEKIHNIKDTHLYSKVVEKYLDFETFYIKKATVNYIQEGKKQRFSCNIRIKKDSIIWISASKMGIEGMRLKLTRDSVYILDRVHKKYIAKNYQFFNKKFNIELDFHIIQSILTNRLPEYGVKKHKPFHRNFQGKINSKGHYVFYSKGARSYWKGKSKQHKRKSKAIEFIEISPNTLRVEQINICDGTNGSITTENCPYTHLYLNNSNFTLYDKQNLFPQNIEIKGGCSKAFQKTYTSENISNPFEINVSIKSLIINRRNLRFPFYISSKYKKYDE